LQHLAWLGAESVDTANADNEENLGLRSDVDLSGLLGNLGERHLLLGKASVLIHVLLGAAEIFGALVTLGLRKKQIDLGLK